MTVEQIAMVCYEANRAYCDTLQDQSQKPWAEAEQWQRDSAIAGVEYRLANPTAPRSAQHESWMKAKQEVGWTYGEVKDPVNKVHPCMVPYDQLPEEQRKKDALFQAVVDALSGIDSGMVLIPSSEYASLSSSEAKLRALEGAGVDNWSGYSDAMSQFFQEEEN